MTRRLCGLVLAVLLVIIPFQSVAEAPPIIPEWAKEAGKSPRTLCLAGLVSYSKRIEWCGALEEWGLRGTFRFCMAAAAGGGNSWRKFCKTRFD